jgi:hypothetical protein
LIGSSGVGVKAGDADAGDVGVLRAPREDIRGTPHALAVTGIVVAGLEGGDRLLIVERFEEADCFVSRSAREYTIAFPEGLEIRKSPGFRVLG